MPARAINVSWMVSILSDMGIDLEDPNFKDTPTRWLKYLGHYMQPFDVEACLGVTFPPTSLCTAIEENKPLERFDNAMIVQIGIPFRAICAHHLVPVLGTAHIGYIPTTKVVGLSKLSRLISGISHASPSLQEDVCNAVTTALMDSLDPLGAMCVISAEHGCMAARGVEEATGCIKTATASVKGVFIDKHETRAEFYRLVGLSK